MMCEKTLCDEAVDRTLSLTFFASVVFFCFESSHIWKFVLGVDKVVEETDFRCHKPESIDFSLWMSLPCSEESILVCSLWLALLHSLAP